MTPRRSGAIVASKRGLNPLEHDHGRRRRTDDVHHPAFAVTFRFFARMWATRINNEATHRDPARGVGGADVEGDDLPRVDAPFNAGENCVTLRSPPTTMRIAILGSGTMGSALGHLFTSVGHHVAYSFSRDPKKLERLARSGGPRARAALPADAVHDADVVVLAVLWQHVPRALRAAGNLRGKVLVDCTNPLTLSDDALAVGLRTSGAEIIARRARGAHVVKAFNTVPAELLRAGVAVLPEQPAVCYCGDDVRAKRVTARLIRQLGFEPVSCGALASARYLEPLAMLVGELAYNQGKRPEVGLRILRRTRPRTN